MVEKFGVFPEQLVAIYMEQVLQGLHYLHSHNIIHRDIKGLLYINMILIYLLGPNILITKEGIVKLAGFFFFYKIIIFLDFGIAITSKIETPSPSKNQSCMFKLRNLKFFIFKPFFLLL